MTQKKGMVSLRPFIVITVFFIASLIFAIGREYPYANFPQWIGIGSQQTIQSTEENSVKKITKTTTPAKSLWDFLELIIVPFAISFAVYWLGLSEHTAAIKREENNQQEIAIRDYFNIMSDLVLKSEPESRNYDQISTLARARTKNILNRLDGKRKMQIVRFIYETGLIKTGESILSFSGANFRSADLEGATLIGCDLSAADFREANLRFALLVDCHLARTDFRGADLFGAKLSWSNLVNAIFERADLQLCEMFCTDLRQAVFIKADLYGADLQGAIIERGSLHKGVMDIATYPLWREDWNTLDRYKYRMADFFEETNLKKAIIPEDEKDLLGEHKRMKSYSEIIWAKPIGIQINNISAYDLYFKAYKYLYYFGFDEDDSKAIIEQREKIGRFESINDFLQDYGVKKQVLEKLAKIVTFDS